MQNAEAADGVTSSSLSQRIAAITAELNLIQKALVAILGLGAVSALSDDGYNDNVPPIWGRRQSGAAICILRPDNTRNIKPTSMLHQR